VQFQRQSRRRFLLMLGQGSVGSVAIAALAACGGAVSTATTTASSSPASAAPTTSAVTTSAAISTAAATSQVATSQVATTTAAATQAASSVSASAPASSAVAPSGANVTLRFLSWRPAAMDQFVPIWAEYQQKNKIAIEVDKTGDYAQTKLDTQLAAGTAPDLWDGRTDTLPKTYNAGQVLQLDTYLAQDKINMVQDYALTEVERWRQKTYGIPYWSEPFAVYYNKTLFKAKGVPDPWEATQNPGDWTINDMLSAAQKLSDPANDTWGLDWAFYDFNGIGTLIWTLGASHLQYDPKITTQLAIPESLAAHQMALDWLNRLAINVSAPTPQAQASAKKLQAGRPGISGTGGTNLFSTGHIGMHWRSVNDWPRMWPLIKNSFEWDILPVFGMQGKPGGSWMGGHPMNAWAQTKHPDDAWAFMRWIMGDEFQTFLAQHQYLVPAKLSAQPTFFRPPAQYPYQHPQVFAGVPKRPHGVIWSHFNAAKNQTDYNTQVLDIYSGKVPLGSGLQDLSARLNQDIAYGGGDNPFAGMRWPFQNQ
jgi:ABC-type glycerol-3-phosphate transport system substrate-binding protein